MAPGVKIVEKRAKKCLKMEFLRKCRVPGHRLPVVFSEQGASTVRSMISVCGSDSPFAVPDPHRRAPDLTELPFQHVIRLVGLESKGLSRSQAFRAHRQQQAGLGRCAFVSVSPQKSPAKVPVPLQGSFDFPFEPQVTSGGVRTSRGFLTGELLELGFITRAPGSGGRPESFLSPIRRIRPIRGSFQPRSIPHPRSLPWLRPSSRPGEIRQGWCPLKMVSWLAALPIHARYRQESMDCSPSGMPDAVLPGTLAPGDRR